MDKLSFFFIKKENCFAYIRSSSLCLVNDNMIGKAMGNSVFRLCYIEMKFEVFKLDDDNC